MFAHAFFAVIGNSFMAAWLVLLSTLIITPALATRSFAEPFATPSDWTSANRPFLPSPESLFQPDAMTASDRSTFFDMDEGSQTGNEEFGRGIDDPVAAPSMPSMPSLPSSLSQDLQSDRFWLINTRSLSHNSCRMNLNQPNLPIERLDRCGRRQASSLDDYLSSMDSNRPRIIYIHGNRRDASTAIKQGLFVYHQLARNRPSNQAFDWVIWSWPSEGQSMLLSDVREKARRTDSQSLYLAWLLREHHVRSQPTGLVGFSFGARIVSGSLHALAGGTIGQRTLGAAPITGANIDVGFLAPAVDTTWMMPRGHHALATQNMNRLVLLYNQRDFALKYFKLISRVPGTEALGFTGPRCFAPRVDGTPLPIRARDCSNTVGNHHSEKQYYQHSCCAGREIGSLIDSCMVMD